MLSTAEWWIIAIKDLIRYLLLSLVIVPVKCMLSTAEWWIIAIKDLIRCVLLTFSDCSSDCLESDLVIQSNTVY